MSTVHMDDDRMKVRDECVGMSAFHAFRHEVSALFGFVKGVMGVRLVGIPRARLDVAAGLLDEMHRPGMRQLS